MLAIEEFTMVGQKYVFPLLFDRQGNLTIIGEMFFHCILIHACQTNSAW